MTGSTSTQQQTSRSYRIKFTDLEKELQGINLDIVKQQFQTLINQADFQQKAYQVIEPALANMLQQQQVEAGLFTPEQQRQRMLDQIAREDQMYAAQDELLQTELARIRGGTGATDEQKALINAATEAQIQRGESDIKAFGQDALQMISQELAPSRGLRPTDTPIQDRGNQVGKEMTRQYGQLVTGLRGEQAQTELNFPLAANQQQAGFSQYQQQLNQSALQFNQQLQQQAQQNRLNLFGQTGTMGLNLYGVGQPYASLQQAFKPQIGQYTQGTSSTSSGGVSGQDVAMAAALGLAMFCSKMLKKNMKPVDYQDILDRLKEIPVEAWEYIYPEHGESGYHIGPYAEDFSKVFSIGDGRKISTVDAIGILMASVKALAETVDRMKSGGE